MRKTSYLVLVLLSLSQFSSAKTCFESMLESAEGFDAFFPSGIDFEHVNPNDINFQHTILGKFVMLRVYNTRNETVRIINGYTLQTPSSLTLAVGDHEYPGLYILGTLGETASIVSLESGDMITNAQFSKTMQRNLIPLKDGLKGAIQEAVQRARYQI